MRNLRRNNRIGVRPLQDAKATNHNAIGAENESRTQTKSYQLSLRRRVIPFPVETTCNQKFDRGLELSAK